MRYAIKLVIIVIVAVSAYWIFGKSFHSAKNTLDFRNATYVIDNNPLTLTNGVSEQEAASGSATKVTTKIFGEPAYGDLNNDSINDAALIMVRDAGGSGTFYYAVALLDESENAAQGTNAVLLGDRIAPQNIEISNGQIIVHYAVRALDEPMSTQPSLGISKHLLIDGNTLEEGKRVVFNCADEKSIVAIFHPDNDTQVELKLSDGRELNVPHAISTSGTRYANKDGNFIFWNKGNDATIQEHGKETFRNCTISQ
ncbi:MAG: MliC family protein [Patescibacteria group bacterium]|nr:MliC family protein [Patescibacteria group bacterium]